MSANAKKTKMKKKTAKKKAKQANRRKVAKKKTARNKASRKKSGQKKSSDKKTATKKLTRKKSARKKSARKKSARKKTARKKTARKKTARKKTAKKKTARKKTAKKKTAKKKTAKKKTAKKKTAKKKTAKKKTAKKKTAKKKTAKKKTAKKKTAKKKTAKKKTAKKKTAKKKTAKKKTAKKKTKLTALDRQLITEIFGQGQGGLKRQIEPSRIHVESTRSGALEQIVSGAEMRVELKQRNRELAEQKQIAEKALKENLKKLTSNKCGEITGYCVGLRFKKGHVVSPLQYVIQIHVRCKHPISVLNLEEITQLPGYVTTKWKGESVRVNIKVLENCPVYATGGIALTSNIPAVPIDNDTVVRGGDPIAPENVGNWGTFGMRIPLNDGTTFVGITNAHVGPLGAQMVNPPAQNVPTPRFGVVDRWTFGNPSSVLNVDGASIALSSSRIFSDGILGFPPVPFLFPRARLSKKTTVSKFGAGTHRKIDADIVNLSFNNLTVGGRNYSELIHSQGDNEIITGGDSGCLAVVPIIDLVNNENAFLIVGVFFARNELSHRDAYACHWPDIADQLGLTGNSNPDRNIRSDLMRSSSQFEIL